MVQLKPGDRVNCRLKEGTIVKSDVDHDEVKTFEVVATGDFGFYYLFVPQYYMVKDTIYVDERCRKRLKINHRFLGEEIIHISEEMISRIVQRMDGMCCAICDNFVPMSKANQEDDTFVCWSCVQNPYH